ncbi:hypothetical protein ACGYLV_10280 [Sulfitobacter sp. M21595]|uniref:hypothetical protein n=1 Tax=Sulfitobacter sp. M21595 TaxID=3368574 RepID=UPI003745DAAC
MSDTGDYFAEYDKADQLYKKRISELDRTDPDYWSDKHYFMAHRDVSAEMNSMSNCDDVQNYLGFIARTKVDTIKSSLDTRLILRMIPEMQSDLKAIYRRQRLILIAVYALTGIAFFNLFQG